VRRKWPRLPRVPDGSVSGSRCAVYPERGTLGAMTTRTSISKSAATARGAALQRKAPSKGVRESTSLRLNPKEKALILKAAESQGDDLGSFIRNAARARAVEVLEDAEYREYMEQKLRHALEMENKGTSLTQAQMRRRFTLRTKQK
jgi:uncharacterized protein (DUF1778 family)